jgi:hypothetical protein
LSSKPSPDFIIDGVTEICLGQQEVLSVNPQNFNSNDVTILSSRIKMLRGLNEDLIKQQYKGNVLQYKGNSSNYSKNTIYSKIIQGTWSNRKRCYASQQVKYTNPNTNFFAQSGNSNILLNGNPTNYPVKCPPYSNLVYYNSNQRANPNVGVISNGGVFLYNQQVQPCSGYVKNNLPSNYCFSTSCSNVPGKEMLLCYKSTTNPYYPKPRRVMTDVGGKFPINYKPLPCNSANATPSETKDCV